jgi:arginine decarboxylase
VSLRDVKRTLEVHELKADERYYLAVFLVGAYQETLGDLHNLFGDTHVVHVRLHDEGGWWIEEIVKGDTANKVLEYMEYDVAELYPALARDCERAIRDGRMTLAHRREGRRAEAGHQHAGQIQGRTDGREDRRLQPRRQRPSCPDRDPEARHCG